MYKTEKATEAGAGHQTPPGAAGDVPETFRGALLKRGTLVVVAGNFFPGEDGGPFYESARISFQDLEVERARFRMPYFSIRIEEIREVFPERRFP